jgi:hypothetical protein
MADRSNRLKRLALPIGAVVALLVLMRIASNRMFNTAPAVPSVAASTLFPSPSSTSRETPGCRDTGAYAESCEGVWLRAVVAEAGYAVIGEGNHAWAVATGDNEFYLWATQAQEEPAFGDFLVRESYDVHFEFGQGVVHFSSISLKYVWETQGLLVWIGEPTRAVATSVVERSLNASVRTSTDLT